MRPTAKLTNATLGIGLCTTITPLPRFTHYRPYWSTSVSLHEPPRSLQYCRRSAETNNDLVNMVVNFLLGQSIFILGKPSCRETCHFASRAEANADKLDLSEHEDIVNNISIIWNILEVPGTALSFPNWVLCNKCCAGAWQLPSALSSSLIALKPVS